MPKRSSIDLGAVKDVFVEFRSNVVDLNGNILPPSSEIWDQMSRKLSFPSSAKYLYTMLKMNRYSLHEQVGITCATVASGFNSAESILRNWRCFFLLRKKHRSMNLNLHQIHQTIHHLAANRISVTIVLLHHKLLFSELFLQNKNGRV